MSDIQTIEEVESILKKAGFETEKGGIRIINAKSALGKFSIERWGNVMYLYTTNPSATIPFHSFKKSGTWPNSAKENLQFYYNEEVCCIIPVEFYAQSEV